MEIISGVIQKAKKVVVYGPEGIGKSTFASRFPNPIFVDTEGSTNGMNVARTPKPSSWEMLNNYIKELMSSKQFATIIIDTIDWAEQLCITSICDRYQKKGIEDFGYGNGYVYEKEEFGKFLNLLQDVVDSGINVVLTAHAQLRKFEQPDEMGAYDRWELKIGKKTGSQISPLVKEWADIVLFANYKTFAVATDKDGKKFKAQGGERVMYTNHHPCWDAKNRYDLPECMAFDYAGIAQLFNPPQHTAQPSQQAQQTRAISNVPTASQPQQQEEVNLDNFTGFEEMPKELIIPEGIPVALGDLMKANEVSEEEIRRIVGQKGYYTEDTPITNYDPNFINGCLVGAWEQVYQLIKNNQKSPF